MNRRDCLKTVGGAMLASTGAAAAAGGTGNPFYKGTTFDPAAAKEAYYRMMERFGYPIPEILRGDDIPE